MSITLFVGDCTEDLAVGAKNFDSSAFLVDFSNFEKFLNITPDSHVTAYTSFADLPKISSERAVFYEVLLKANKIYYLPPVVWSDYKEEFSLENQERITEYFLYLVNRANKNVIGLDFSKYKDPLYLKLCNSRTSTNTSQMWVTGCSVTAGVGVEQNERYASLIATRYNLQWTDLAKGGSSIEYQADQLLRSNIQKNDIVLWGLTSEYRATVWNETTHCINFLTAHTFNRLKNNRADNICDETRVYKALISVKQVINFCNKVGAQLILVPIICTEYLQLMLHHEPTYYQLPYATRPIDVGTDGSHPGPKQHQLYAEQISEIFNKVLKA